MSEPIRVPMPRQPLVGVGDVAVHASPQADAMRVGRRFNFDVSEDVLSRIGGEALAAAVVRMGEAIAYSRRAQIDSQVGERLMRDPAFMAPIIEGAFRESVKELVRERVEVWTDTMMRDAVRDAVRELLRDGLYGGQW